MMMCRRKDPVVEVLASLFYVLIYTGWLLVAVACLTGIPLILMYPDSGGYFLALFSSGCIIGMSAEVFRRFTDE